MHEILLTGSVIKMLTKQSFMFPSFHLKNYFIYNNKLLNFTSRLCTYDIVNKIYVLNFYDTFFKNKNPRISMEKYVQGLK